MYYIKYTINNETIIDSVDNYIRMFKTYGNALIRVGELLNNIPNIQRIFIFDKSENPYEIPMSIYAI